MTSAGDSTVAAMCALIGEVLDVPDVTAADDFFDLGGTSLKAAVLVAQIERRFGVRLTAGDLYEEGTARALAARLSTQRSPEEPVFLVHWYPADVAHEIGRHRPAVVLSFGTESNEEWPPPVGIEALAAHYVAQMRRIRPTGPYHLAGYSLGGIIAWEMARQLGEPEMGLLCVIDAHPPEVRWQPLPKSETLRRVARTSPRVLMRKVRYRAIRAMPVSSTAYQMMWNRRDHGGRLELIDHRLAEYRMQPFGGRLLLIEASSPSRHSVLYQTPPPLGRTYADRGLAVGNCRLVDIQGDHRSMIKGAQARQIADAIESEIAAL